MRVAIVRAGIACLSVALAAVPAAALTITETFETLGPRNTVLPSVVTSIGTITGLAGVPTPNVYLAAPGFTSFGVGNNPTTSTILSANGDEHFEANLVFAARTVQMDVFLNDFGPSTLRFFNGTNLLGEFVFAVSQANFQTVSFTAPAAGIDRFTFVSTAGSVVNTGIDNVSITAAVPEPAGWAMMIAGFGLIGSVRRRQSAAAA